MKRARLPITFDPEPLKRDLAAIRPEEWVPHFNQQYYEGDWSGVALRSIAGAPLQLYPDPAAEGEWAPTPLLASCPAFADVLAAFECPQTSARLLRLGAGARIREHTDFNLGLDDGEIRIHVPITTNPQVEFRHDGELVEMREGEAWYLDLKLTHALANNGDSPRVHLVVDCVVNDWLRGQLEAATLASSGQRPSS